MDRCNPNVTEFFLIDRKGTAAFVRPGSGSYSVHAQRRPLECPLDGESKQLMHCLYCISLWNCTASSVLHVAPTGAGSTLGLCGSLPSLINLGSNCCRARLLPPHVHGWVPLKSMCTSEPHVYIIKLKCSEMRRYSKMFFSCTH
jgi:hypothetical protein